MQANSNFLISTLINSGPTALLCVLGVIFALVQREKAPKAAIFVIISLVALLLLVIVRPIGYHFLSQMNGDARFTLFSVWNFGCTLVDVASTAGLIFAAFCDRSAPLGATDPFALQHGGVPQSTNPYIAPKPLPPLGGSFRPPQ